MVCVIGGAVTSLRLPDYLSLDASVPIPFAPFIRVGVNLTYTRDGKLYFSPPWRDVSVGLPGGSASARAGWIDPPWGPQPSTTDVDNFISGPSLTGSGYAPVVGVPGLVGVGPSIGEQWGNEGQLGWKNFSTEVGVGVGVGRNASATQSWSSLFPFPFQGPGW